MADTAIHPPARTATTTDEGLEVLARSQEQVAQHLGGVRSALTMGKAGATTVDQRRINKRLGRDLPKAGRAAAQTVRLCEGPFAAVDITVAGILDKVRRVEKLGNGKAADQLSTDLGGEVNTAIAALAEDTEKVVDIVTAMRANPATDPDLLARLLAAAASLLAILEERNEATRTAAAGTRALRSEVEDTHATVSRLRLEKKVLAGEKIGADDISEATPLAARTGRRPGRSRKKAE